MDTELTVSIDLSFRCTYVACTECILYFAISFQGHRFPRPAILSQRRLLFSRNPGGFHSLSSITANGNIIKITSTELLSNPNSANVGNFAVYNGELSVCTDLNGGTRGWRKVTNATN